VIHFDTSFVVDFLREGTRGELGPARALFKSLPRQPHAISVFALCELLAGVAQASRGDQEREKVRLFCSRLRTVYPGEGFAEDYGSIVGTLKRSGRNPRAMDVLIATAAVRDGAHLVTRDSKDFLGVPGLEVISY
jgi:predicted nucleic acid-binding protein